MKRGIGVAAGNSSCSNSSNGDIAEAGLPGSSSPGLRGTTELSETERGVDVGRKVLLMEVALKGGIFLDHALVLCLDCENKHTRGTDV